MLNHWVIVLPFKRQSKSFNQFFNTANVAEHHIGVSGSVWFKHAIVLLEAFIHANAERSLNKLICSFIVVLPFSYGNSCVDLFQVQIDELTEVICQKLMLEDEFLYCMESLQLSLQVC